MATIDTPGTELGSLVVGAGAVWVREQFYGTISRIDPETNAVVATIDVAPGCCLAIADGTVWATQCVDDTVVRIDPATTTVVATIAVEDHPEKVAAGLGAVWVSNLHDGSVSDPASNQVVATVRVAEAGPAGPKGSAVADNAIWVGVPKLAAVVRIDRGPIRSARRSRSRPGAVRCMRPTRPPCGSGPAPIGKEQSCSSTSTVGQPTSSP